MTLMKRYVSYLRKEDADSLRFEALLKNCLLSHGSRRGFG